MHKNSTLLFRIGLTCAGVAVAVFSTWASQTPASHAHSTPASAALNILLMFKRAFPVHHASGQLSSAVPLQGRRFFLSTAAAAAVAGAASGFAPLPASAFIAGTDEEKSGLVVLRVAEVCSFQEKLLRTLAACADPKTKDAKDQFGNRYCGGEAYAVNPYQIVFGTGLMLKNGNLDGNLKLMIYTDVPRPQRKAAIAQGIEIMNIFTKLSNTASQYKEFDDKDYILIADIYKEARQELARFFDYLPEEAQSRFYGFAEDVRKYEEKVSSEDGIVRMGS